MLLLDLRGLSPSPQRLLSVVKELSAHGETWSGVIIDWGDRFPWGRHPGFDRSAHPESVVAEVAACCERHQMPCFFLLRTPFASGVSAIAEFRHIERASRGVEHERWANAMRAFLNENMDDLFSLVPSIAGVVSLGGHGEHPNAWDYIASSLGRDGRSVLSLTEGFAADRLRPQRTWPLVLHSDFKDRQGAFLGSMEMRLSSLSDTSGVPDSPIPTELHDRLSRWRGRAWAIIAECYEELTRGLRDPLSPDRRSVEQVTLLRNHLRSFRSIREKFFETYEAVASREEIGRFLSSVSGPVRERLGELGGRLSAYRRHP